jgi:hypothetical protein
MHAPPGATQFTQGASVSDISELKLSIKQTSELPYKSVLRAERVYAFFIPFQIFDLR